MIRAYLERRKAKKAEMEDLLKESLRKLREEAYLEADRKIKEMTSKYCPVNESCCTESCIHFEKSVTRTFTSFSTGEIVHYTTETKCKLWRR